MINLGDKVKIKAKESELYGFVGIARLKQNYLGDNSMIALTDDNGTNYFLANISYFLIETAEGREWIKSIDLEKL